MKSVSEKHLPEIAHEFDSRVYVEREKVSYRFDVVEQEGRRSCGGIMAMAKKLVMNSIYEAGASSLFLSIGTRDS